MSAKSAKMSDDWEPLERLPNHMPSPRHVAWRLPSDILGTATSWNSPRNMHVHTQCDAPSPSHNPPTMMGNEDQYDQEEVRLAMQQMISEPDQEEVRLAMEHLDIGFMRRFTRFAFNPTNPFIAGASVLGTVVAAQVYARMLVLV